MKFTINRSIFNEVIQDVQLAISSQTTIPILTGIKITCHEEGITLTGSDADISIESFISIEDEDHDLQIDSTGEMVVEPARFLSDIIKKLPDEKVSLELLNNGQVSIESDTSSFTIHSLDADQYPRLPEIERDKKIILPVNLFKQVVKQTIISVSHHESRPILTGIQFTVQDDVLRAVATDSHRLSRRDITLDQASGENYEIVIPGKSLNELMRLLDDDIEEVELYITENQVLFNIENTKFYSRLLEGNYPNTERLIPTDTNTIVTLDAQELIGAVDRASLLSHAGKNNVVKLSVDSNTMEISGDFPEIGKIEEDIKYENIEGDSIQISFNPDYMKAALQAFGQTEINISFVGSLRPFVLQPSDGSTDFVQLITPIRTPD